MYENDNSPSQELRQPIAKPPETTGNPVVDNANKWLFAASWEAAKVSREAVIRQTKDKAREAGDPNPDLSEVGQPDFTEDDTALLTRLVSSIEEPSTQVMLATLWDMRDSRMVAQSGDPLREQMKVMQVVLSNPNLSTLQS